MFGLALALQQSTFYRAEAFRAVGGFNVENRTSWDAELLLDMGLKGMELKKVPGYWSVFTIHDESITGSQRLAEESARNHRRFFRTVMGRDKTPRDRMITRALQMSQRLANPHLTAMRLRDRMLGAPALPVEGLHVD